MSTATLKLWEITDEYESVLMEVFAADGELTPELEEKLDGLEGSFLEKVERVALKIRELEGDADKAKAEKDRLYTIEKAYRRAADNLKDYLMRQMSRTGQDRVLTPKMRVRIQKNSQPSIRWTKDPEEIPEDYRRVTVSPDLRALKEDMKASDDFTPPDGFRIEYGHHLRIY